MISSASWSFMRALLAKPSQLNVKGPAPAFQDLKVQNTRQRRLVSWVLNAVIVDELVPATVSEKNENK